MNKKIIGIVVCTLLIASGFGGVFGSIITTTAKITTISKEDFSNEKDLSDLEEMTMEEIITKYDPKCKNMTEEEIAKYIEYVRIKSPPKHTFDDLDLTRLQDPLIFNPPWDIAEFDSDKHVEWVADASVGDTGITSSYGYAGKGGPENDFYASAGLPYGKARVKAWFDHGFNYQAPVTGTYTFTYKYSVIGFIFGMDYGDWTGDSYCKNTIRTKFIAGSEEVTETVIVKEHYHETSIDWSKTITITTDLSEGASYYIGSQAFIESYATVILFSGAMAHMGNPDTMEFRLEEVTIDLPYIPQPILEVSPSNYDFGDVDIGSSKTKTFTLKNTGDATAEIYKIYIDNTMSQYFRFASGDPITFANDILLEPGETLDIPVRYKPLMERHNEGRFIVWATNCDNVYVDLEGTGVDPGDDNSCFPAGTKITMADGSYKNIEDINVGDKVLSYNIENKEFRSWKVKVLERPIVHIYNINNGLIKTSRDHPFYIKKQDGRTGWSAIEPLQNAFRISGEILNIEVGDQLFTSDGKWITIKEISYNSSAVQTYNILSYRGNKNYFANDLLVYEDYQTLSYLIRRAFQNSRNPLAYLLNFFRQRNYRFLP